MPKTVEFVADPNPGPATALAITGAPPWAILVWCDLRNIYVQIPSSGSAQPPFIASYPRTEAGLSKALAIMSSRHATEGQAKPYDAPKSYAKRDARFSQNQREGVREMLRRKGVI